MERRQLQAYNRRIFRAVSVVMVVGAVAKLLLALKDILCAYRFGSQADIGLYLAALVVPLFLQNSVLGAFGVVLVPQFLERTARDGRATAVEWLRRQIGAVLLISSILAAALWLSANLLAPHFTKNPAEIARMAGALRVLAPMVIAGALSALFTALLAGDEKFLVGAAGSALPPLFLLAGVLLAAPDAPLNTLCVATSLGYIAYAALLYVAFAYGEAHPVGVRLPLRVELGGWMAGYGAILGASLLGAGVDSIDQLMAARISSESLALLNYGTRVGIFVTSLATLGLGTAGQAYFSRMYASGELPAIRHSAFVYVRLVLVGGALLSFVLSIAAWPIMSVLFQRGAFRISDTEQATAVMQIAVFQIPVLLASTILVRAVIALQRFRELICSAAVVLLGDIVMNLVAIRLIGLPGIALASVLIFVFATGFLGFVVERATRQRS